MVVDRAREGRVGLVVSSVLAVISSCLPGLVSSYLALWVRDSAFLFPTLGHLTSEDPYQYSDLFLVSAFDPYERQLDQLVLTLIVVYLLSYL